MLKSKRILITIEEKDLLKLYVIIVFLINFLYEKYIQELIFNIRFLIYKEEFIILYDLDYDSFDPILKTAVKNRIRRKVKWKGV